MLCKVQAGRQLTWPIWICDRRDFAVGIYFLESICELITLAVAVAAAAVAAACPPQMQHATTLEARDDMFAVRCCWCCLLQLCRGSLMAVSHEDSLVTMHFIVIFPLVHFMVVGRRRYWQGVHMCEQSLCYMCKYVYYPTCPRTLADVYHMGIVR